MAERTGVACDCGALVGGYGPGFVGSGRPSAARRRTSTWCSEAASQGDVAWPGLAACNSCMIRPGCNRSTSTKDGEQIGGGSPRAPKIPIPPIGTRPCLLLSLRGAFEQSDGGPLYRTLERVAIGKRRRAARERGGYPHSKCSS